VIADTAGPGPHRGSVADEQHLHDLLLADLRGLAAVDGVVSMLFDYHGVPVFSKNVVNLPGQQTIGAIYRQMPVSSAQRIGRFVVALYYCRTLGPIRPGDLQRIRPGGIP
jgi:hypothetical protein